MKEAGQSAKPRILLVSHETTLSGAPLQLMYLAESLHRQGWEMVFAAPSAGPISDRLGAVGMRLELVGDLPTDAARQRLEALCRACDVVVANTLISWPAVLAAHHEKIPVLWHLHETEVAVHLARQIDPMREAFLRATLVVVPTRHAAQLFAGVTRAPIEVVPYGIPDVSDFASETSGKSISFIALGSFEQRKGQDILVDAIGQLDRRICGAAAFQLAGRVLDQEFFSELRDRARTLKNVELLETLEHEEALRLLGKSDALVCPSRDETMPISIIEAASLAKPAISTNVGGISEWIHDGLNGLLVPREDSAALASAITRFVETPAIITQLGAAARRTFQRHFRLEGFVAHLAGLLQRLNKNEFRSQAATYQQWITKYDTVTPAGRIELQRRLRALPHQPLISIIMPVFDPELDVLAAAIESVRKQVYENWQLCIADDASTEPYVRPFLKKIAAEDARVKLVLRKRNGHISACSNSALALATGEWCAFLDHDDALTENALALVAMEIGRYPDAGLIYSDQDSVDLAGVRSNPFFKTDWNPELFLGQNYINHLGVYRTSLLHEIGGFREGFEGSQDYDLALRCIERLRFDQIRHIPHILYHWRMVPGSIAAARDAKPYAKEAARRGLSDHLRRRGIAGRVEPCPESDDSHRVIYEVPKSEPLVSILMPTCDKVDVLRRCVGSLLQRTDYPSMELIIIDNGSRERETLDFLQELTEQHCARVLQDSGDFNFSRLNNFAARHANGEIIALLNNDLEIIDGGWLREMVSHVVRPEVGAVGARLWSQEGTLQHGGVILGLAGVADHAFYHIPRGHPGYWNQAWLQRNCSAITAACMVMRKQVFVALGGFEINLAVNFNDVDLCLRLKESGLQIVWTPYAELIHHESSSRGRIPTHEKAAQLLRESTWMQRKWGPELLSDPFYSPNFSLQLPGFDFAFPPRTKNERLGR
jgi:glycosyltransferase involved in cell wall biosynthesis